MGRPPRRVKTFQPRPPSASSADPKRLQVILAAAGFGSRRHCEELILEGRVEIDRHVVTSLGVKADPTKQEVRVDGTMLPRPPRMVYFLVNKPAGVVSTNNDPAGRTRVIDLLPRRRERLFSVGRLDLSSEGLILVTNDGPLANQLAHPRYEVEKTYWAEVAGEIAAEELDRLCHGVHLAEGVVRVARVRVLRRLRQSTQLELVLKEGKNREIRRVLARQGHKVMHLRRTALGPLRLGDLRPGEFRLLSPGEVAALRRAGGGGRPETTGAGKSALKSSRAGGRGARRVGRKKPAASPTAAPKRPTVIGGDVAGASTDETRSRRGKPARPAGGPPQTGRPQVGGPQTGHPRAGRSKPRFRLRDKGKGRGRSKGNR